MESLVIILVDLILLSIYIVLGLGLFLIVQLISYRIFKFNLYKNLKYILIDRELMK